MFMRPCNPSRNFCFGAKFFLYYGNISMYFDCHEAFCMVADYRAFGICGHK